MTNTDNRYEEYIELLKANKNLILTGAPGTGKTYLAKKIAEILVGMQTKSYKNEPVNFNEIIEKYIVPNDYLSSSGRVTYHVDKVENNKVFITGDSIQPYAVPFREIENAYKRRLWEGGGRNGFDPYSSAFAKYIYNHVGTEILNINDDKNLEDRSDCIQFVQFHPSYDYTDFVEGLRPTPPDGNGNIGFERKDGVFKDFCRRCILPGIKSAREKNALCESYASEQTNSKKDISIQYDNSTSFYDLYKELKHRIQNHTVTLYTVYPRTKMDVQVFGDDIMYNKGGSFSSNYINADYVQKIFNYYRDKGIYDVSRSRFNDFSSIIGNTLNYTYYRGIVQELLNMCKRTNSHIDDYSDKKSEFVQSDKVYIQDHVYEEDEANICPSECNYVFIIDEINRGELSKIFGELFFSIDPGYRGKKGLVKTQYQNLITDKSDPFYDGFYVPENVYIIGTMNDIDRSVESMDFAMRRRFAWKEVRSDENTGMLDDLGSMKLDVVAKMNRLNEAIWNDATNDGIEGLSRAYHIGGAYFRKLKLYLNDDFSNKDEAYRKLWDNHLRGVLFEYLRGSIDASENMKMLENVYFSE